MLVQRQWLKRGWIPDPVRDDVSGLKLVFNAYIKFLTYTAEFPILLEFDLKKSPKTGPKCQFLGIKTAVDL